MGLWRSSRFQAEGDAVCPQTAFQGHVACSTKPLLVQQDTVTLTRDTETRAHGNTVYLPVTVVPIYLLALACFRTARLAGAGKEQRELTPIAGI